MSPAVPSTAAAPANEPLLLRHDDDGIVTLTLNRPRQYNALCEALLGELQTQLDAIAGDATIRIVVIAGAGQAFCAGHDLKEMRARPDQAYYRDLFRRCSRLMLTITQMPQPVIARVHGIATAAGCQLVAMADLAVAADGARFALPGVGVGVFCSTPAVGVGRNIARKRLM
jgi:enoyl-CoA hydratase/carnithine racemase